MTAPNPPAGAVAHRPILTEFGEIARWRHADVLPFLEVALFAASDEVVNARGKVTRQAQPARVDLGTGPARYPLKGVTDPRELERCAWLLLASARWLRRQQDPADQARCSDPDPFPQLTIYDCLETP